MVKNQISVDGSITGTSTSAIDLEKNIFKVYAIDKYLGKTNKFIDNDYDEYSLKELKKLLKSDNGYLCDYTINVPIFSVDPPNKNICEYLIKNYRNVIIYCNSQIEGEKINNLMNKIQKKCSAYIDCNTNRTDRDKIIKKYKKEELPFLVNVRILVEGFDAPITKGIYFMHMPSSKTTLIQLHLQLHLEQFKIIIYVQ